MAQHIIYFVILLTVNFANANYAGSSGCKVLARTTAGWVCGTNRVARNGQNYASFRGVPYAKQPLGELRFQELKPADPWDGIYNAFNEGPVCPYVADVTRLIYGALFQPQGMSESCINANVHVPLDALPDPYKRVETRGLPIVVFIHGGSWVSGSKDVDINGPEYLVGKNVIVITFNYRLDVFGLLSMNNSKIPGNNSLRDAVTLLRWVQDNARYFGGDPDQVTLAGQSVGATSAHLLSLSPAAKGLFKRIWLMSCTATQSYYTTSPVYAKQVANMLFYYLGLNTKDEDEIYNYLIHVPIEKLLKASGKLLEQQGLTGFVPVVETPQPGFTTILPEDPEVLLARGYGNNIPMVLGFANKECESLRPRLVAGDVVEKYKRNPLTSVPKGALYGLPSRVTEAMAEKIRRRYFKGTPTMDEYVKMCSDSLFAYPALKTARARVTSGGAPVYLYKFAYNAEFSALKEALNVSYYGAGHSEDMSYIFKVNSFTVPKSDADEEMKSLMSELFANFVKDNNPSNGEVSWPPYPYNQYFYISDALDNQYGEMSKYDQDMVHFFDTLADV